MDQLTVEGRTTDSHTSIASMLDSPKSWVLQGQFWWRNVKGGPFFWCRYCYQRRKWHFCSRFPKKVDTGGLSQDLGGNCSKVIDSVKLLKLLKGAEMELPRWNVPLVSIKNKLNRIRHYEVALVRRSGIRVTLHLAKHARFIESLII
ncbi:unnamed protein product [Ilex paraguariensis]|uniref:Uncharacterized protein n=1 Tax=Ilex paraguariensis TaxID=185542 RepID=A0ABC8QUZ0_9AQUA